MAIAAGHSPGHPKQDPGQQNETLEILQQLTAAITAQSRSKSQDDDSEDDVEWKLSKADKSINHWLNETKFSGTYDEDWVDHLQEFENVCDGYAIASAGHISLLKPTLKDEGKVFFNNAIIDCDFTWDLRTLFADESSHEAKQTLFLQQLKTLPFKDLKTDGQSDEVTLNKLWNRLHKLSVMAEKEYQTNCARRRILYKVVLGEAFPLLAFSHLHSSHKYSDLKQALYKSIVDHLENESLTATSNVLCTPCYKNEKRLCKGSRSSSHR